MSFGSQEFWEAWYSSNLPMNQEDSSLTKNESIDWYADFEQISNIISKYIEATFSVLFVGCGNSPIAEIMEKNGHVGNLINIDFSETVIHFMKEKFSPQKNIQYIVGDICDLTSIYPETHQFDIILDKGTLDAMLSSDVFIRIFLFFFFSN